MSERGILETENLRIATEMYETVLAPLDPAEVDRYFASDYIQHGSLASDGRDALKGFLEQARKEYPDVRSRIVRSFADGNHVIFHVHVVLQPGDGGLAVVDIFRVKDGLMAEHWEVIQPVPDALPHANGTF